MGLVNASFVRPNTTNLYTYPKLLKNYKFHRYCRTQLKILSKKFENLKIKQILPKYGEGVSTL